MAQDVVLVPAAVGPTEEDVRHRRGTSRGTVRQDAFRGGAKRVCAAAKGVLRQDAGVPQVAPERHQEREGGDDGKRHRKVSYHALTVMS